MEPERKRQLAVGESGGQRTAGVAAAAENTEGRAWQWRVSFAGIDGPPILEVFERLPADSLLLSTPLLAAACLSSRGQCSHCFHRIQA